MSFLKSIFNAVCDAGSELLETQQEYSDEFARVNDYQLKQAYRNAKAHHVFLLWNRSVSEEASSSQAVTQVKSSDTGKTVTKE